MLCPVMQLDFTEAVGRYDEDGGERYSDEDLRYGVMWADHYLAQGIEREPMRDFDLREFGAWCRSKLEGKCQ